MPDIRRKMRNMVRQFQKKINDIQQNTPEYNRLRTENRSIGYQMAYERYVVQLAPYTWVLLIIGVVVGAGAGVYLANDTYSMNIDIFHPVLRIIIGGAGIGASIVYWSINIWYRFQRKQNK